MGYAEEYKQKLVTAAQAAAVIQDGDWVEGRRLGRLRRVRDHKRRG